MKRIIGAVFVAVMAANLGGFAWADDEKDVKAILDKALTALGGEEKLSKVKAASWKAKAKINFGGNETGFNSETTVQGLDHFRSTFEADNFAGLTVVHGDKGWRKFGEDPMEMDKDGVANEKRNVYLQVIPITLVALKGKEFKVVPAGEEKVDGKAAVGLQITGPDGKDFKLYFDKESGLPVKQVAKVAGFMGGEFAQETTYGGYKDFDGIKKATKIEAKRDGEKFMEQEVVEFKVLDKVDSKLFDEPK